MLIVNLRPQFLRVVLGCPMLIFLPYTHILSIILLHKVIEASISSKLHKLKLVDIPLFIVKRLDVGVVHTKLAYMTKSTIFA